jgi:hypothetical protein
VLAVDCFITLFRLFKGVQTESHITSNYQVGDDQAAATTPRPQNWGNRTTTNDYGVLCPNVSEAMHLTVICNKPNHTDVDATLCISTWHSATAAQSTYNIIQPELNTCSENSPKPAQTPQQHAVRQKPHCAAT